jgi:hypothetical protein
MSGQSRPRRVRSSYTGTSRRTNKGNQNFIDQEENSSHDSGESDFDPTMAVDEDDNVTEESESSVDVRDIDSKKYFYIVRRFKHGILIITLPPRNKKTRLEGKEGDKKYWITR